MINYTLESAVYLYIETTLDESNLETLCICHSLSKIEANEPLTTVDALHLTNLLRKNIQKISNYVEN